MNIELRFFASVREALGVAQETLSLPSQVKTIADLRSFLRERGGAWEKELGEDRAVRTAYNQNMSASDTVITDGGEVAFFPPVTGG